MGRFCGGFGEAVLTVWGRLPRRYGKAAWMVWAGCLKGVLRLSRGWAGCLEGMGRLLGGYWEAVLRVCGDCLEGVVRISGGCEEAV